MQSCPSREDLELAYKSFKPGISENQRYDMQSTSKFYTTHYSSSGFASRLNSFQSRLKSASNFSTRSMSRPKGPNQAKHLTCQEMRQEVQSNENIANYSIKKKHHEKLACFFDSKNFELRTNIKPEEPKVETKKGGGGAKAAGKDPKASGKTPRSPGINSPSEAGLEIDTSNLLVVKGSVEKDVEEVDRQENSTWAHRFGLPNKTAAVMHHGVTI